MRTVSYRLADLQKAVITIGKVGENDYTRVVFDCKKVFDEYPSASPSLSVINPAGTAYPVVVTHEGDYVMWDVADSDLIAQGNGEAQLTFTSDGTVIKTYVFRTRIERSIVADGETPDPVQNWLDEAAGVLEEVEEAIPAGGTTGQVLAKKSNADRDLEWVDQTGGGGGGTTNYNALSNKPQIGGVELQGDKSLHELGIAAESSIPDVTGKADKVTGGTENNFAALDANGNLKDSGKKASDFATPSDVNAKYTKPQNGIPSSDMASAVQTSLGKADSAYQLPSGGIPSSDMASAVQTSLGKADTAYQLPSGGVPASDLASAVQTSLGKADSAYQKPGSGIPASDMASGVIPVLTDLIDDTAGEGDTDKVLSADKVTEELTSLSSAITNILVQKTVGEEVTLTNSKNATQYYNSSSTTVLGLTKSSIQDGVATYLSDNAGRTTLEVNNVASAGTKKWIVGFKYRITKVNSNIANPENVRIYLGQSDKFDNNNYEWGVWTDFCKTIEVNLTRIYILVRNFTTAPGAGDFKLEVKDMYLYDASDVSAEMCEYIMQKQSANYTDGTVTYSTIQSGMVPDDGLNTQGKAADSKAVGDRIGSVRFNVKDYGVKGDGSTDDTTAIRSLFTSKTGTFYFPAGTYKITGTISIPANSEIVGDGDVSIINMYTCTDLTQCTFRTGDYVYPYILITHDNCAVRHIKLIGNNTLQEKRHAGIGVLDADRCSIEDVTISNINYDSSQTTDASVSGYGICVTRSTFVDVVKCDVRTCGYECIGIVDECNYCTVRDCYTQDGWRTCIQVHKGSCNTLIDNNYMKQTHDKYHACFTVHGASDKLIKNLRVENNTIECTQNGLQPDTANAPAQIMSYTEGFVFIGNRIKGGKRAFFIYSDSTNAKIIGNDMQCNNSSDYGVYINSLNTIIFGNYLLNEAQTPANQIANNPIIVGNVGIGDTIYNASGVSF